MESFRLMCNDAIRIGLAGDASTLKRLSKLTYGDLGRYEVPSCYKLCAISKAAGILAARKKSISRGFPTKNPCLSKLLLVSCYRFKIENGSLLVPLGDHKFEGVPLNAHTLAAISQTGVKVRSFTLTERSLSLCIAMEVEEKQVGGVLGIDRNLRNVTVGNAEQVTSYDVSKTVEIAETTRSVVRSFRRNDVRIRKKLAASYGRRRQERVRQILNRVSKSIIAEARVKKQAIAFEDITDIRKLYRTGNGQGNGFRGRMNSWPFAELKRQVEYKAAWEGVPVITLTKGETRGITMDCVRCGERLQEPVRGDGAHHRQLWCEGCKRWDDRDPIAVMNISRRAWLRFVHAKGGAGESDEGEP
ncbi:MAG: transposase [Thaumarchaeota archaeon]|nr:transposase [Nitrososphaerota archaeon]